MKAYLTFALLMMVTFHMPSIAYADEVDESACLSGTDQDFRRLHSGESLNLCDEFAGQPMLIVNTASHCGFTPQFKQLEAIHKKYADDGLVVIGFPSDDFHQEAAEESKTAEVCYINYGVSFTMLAPMKVKGPEAHPVFKQLADKTQPPRWNFTKYLVSREGEVTHRFGSNVKPDAKKVTDAIESLL